jgi:hypothetical protein
LAAAEAAFLAATQRQKMHVTIEKRTTATTASPPREMLFYLILI